MSVSFDPKYIKFNTTSSGSTLLTGILGYWKFNETSGTNINDEVSTNDITTDSTASSSGKIGYCRDFNSATPNYAYVEATPIDPTTDKISISLWFYLDSTASTLGHDICLLRYDYNSGTPWQTIFIKINSLDNKIVGAVTNSTSTLYSVGSSSAMVASQWYHVVFVCRGNSQTLQLWVDGLDVSTGAETFSGTNILSSDGNLSVGNNYSGGDESLDGRIDEIGIWNKDLSSTEIASLYATGSGLEYPF